ncbi:MAG: beta-lactamase family protein [Halioglobus sp.]|nr:beta-lactamase family protein [Halioglobus sp.]
MRALFLTFIALLAALPAWSRAEAAPGQLQQALEHLVAQQVAPAITVVAVRHGELLFEASAGLADPQSGRRMTGRTPLRQASVTKPYVATTVIQLAAEKNIPLATPIKSLLPRSFLDPLVEAGYEPAGITLDHLLTHTSGLRDHTNSWRYMAISFLLRWQAWTALEQVELLPHLGPPLWPPGENYAYSDTGYVLLGQIVEQLSGRSLAAAVREYARFDDIGLQATWWELAETTPDSLEPMARQYMDGWEVSNLHPTIDLFGGGGLIATTLDAALFLDALFSKAQPGGLVLRDPVLLARFLGEGDDPVTGSYKRGIAKGSMNGTTVYVHSGFWGTAVYHFPELEVTIAGAVTDRNGIPALRQAIATAAAIEIDAGRED